MTSDLPGGDSRLSNRTKRLAVGHKPWLDCVKRYDSAHTLFYMDPPYWDTAGYGVKFGVEQYVAMADAMRSRKGRALVSVNDHPKMREAFAGFPMRGPPTSATRSGWWRAAI